MERCTLCGSPVDDAGGHLACTRCPGRWSKPRPTLEDCIDRAVVKIRAVENSWNLGATGNYLRGILRDFASEVRSLRSAS